MTFQKCNLLCDHYNYILNIIELKVCARKKKLFQVIGSPADKKNGENGFENIREEVDLVTARNR